MILAMRDPASQRPATESRNAFRRVRYWCSWKVDAGSVVGILANSATGWDLRSINTGVLAMTWIGKILTILVMVAALIWMFLNVQTYVTRTNWYAEAKKYREGYNTAIAAREADYRAGQTEIDSM